MNPTKRRFVIGALIVVGVVLMGLLAFQRQLIYFPGGQVPPVDEVLRDATSVTITTSDGLELEAWFIEAGPTAVLVLPGNAGNRAARAPLGNALADLGLSVLLLDYRGYGGNPGSPTEEGLVTDARAAWSWLEDRPGIDRIVTFGESLGTGVATALALETPPAALILRSPFPSLAAVAREHYGPVPDWLLLDRYPTAERLAQVDVPTLVIVGEDDRIIPPQLSRQVAEAAAGPVEFVTIDGAGHNDRALLDGDQFITAIDDFLRRHGISD